MKILVTGAKGQLGSELQSLSPQYPQFEFLFTDLAELDITSLEAITAYFDLHSPDLVLNCAAYTQVDKAETDTELAQSINCEAVWHLVENCKRRDISIIHVSTDYVFDGQNYKPYSEDDEVNPLSVYGTTKLEGELPVMGYEKGIVIRTSWVYSSFGNNFVKTMLRLAQTKGEISVVADQVGTPTYAKDLAYAMLVISDKIRVNPKEIEPTIYHYSNEGVCSWYDFALEIFELSKTKCKVIPIPAIKYPTPASRPYYSVLSKERIKGDFGIEIPHWKDGLRRCLTFLT